MFLIDYFSDNNEQMALNHSCGVSEPARFDTAALVLTQKTTELISCPGDHHSFQIVLIDNAPRPAEVKKEVLTLLIY